MERRFFKDELLTNVTLYWLTETIDSSFRVYRDWALGAESNPHAWEGREEVPWGVASKPLARDERVGVPSAVALFPVDPPGCRVSGPSAPTRTSGASPGWPVARTSPL